MLPLRGGISFVGTIFAYRFIKTKNYKCIMIEINLNIFPGSSLEVGVCEIAGELLDDNDNDFASYLLQQDAPIIHKDDSINNESNDIIFETNIALTNVYSAYNLVAELPHHHKTDTYQYIDNLLQKETDSINGIKNTHIIDLDISSFDQDIILPTTDINYRNYTDPIVTTQLKEGLHFDGAPQNLLEEDDDIIHSLDEDFSLYDLDIIPPPNYDEHNLNHYDKIGFLNQSVALPFKIDDDITPPKFDLIHDENDFNPSNNAIHTINIIETPMPYHTDSLAEIKLQQSNVIDYQSNNEENPPILNIEIEEQNVDLKKNFDFQKIDNKNNAINQSYETLDVAKAEEYHVVNSVNNVNSVINKEEVEQVDIEIFDEQQINFYSLQKKSEYIAASQAAKYENQQLDEMSESIKFQISMQLSQKQKISVFSLYPENLGKVQIEFHEDGINTSVSITAEKSATTDILNKMSKELREILINSGIKAETFSMQIDSVKNDNLSQNTGNNSNSKHQQSQNFERVIIDVNKGENHPTISNNTIIMAGVMHNTNSINIKV